ncbi:hypothetical protein C3E88_03305 [Clostridium sp. Cult3]|nr:hypothetical protein [Clostridium sp. Cult3]
MLQLWLLCLFRKNNKSLKVKKNNYGFTLIELVLSIAIVATIVIPLYSILNFTIDACKVGDIEDEVLLNGKHAIEYIKKEIQYADKIIHISKFEGVDEKYKDNFGFVILNYMPNKELKYNYSTYYLRDNSIYRIAVNSKTDTYPKVRSFDVGGHNKIADYVISIDGTEVDFETNIIDICFILKGEYRRETKFSTKLIIRCPVIY